MDNTKIIDKIEEMTEYTEAEWKLFEKQLDTFLVKLKKISKHEDTQRR